MVLTALYIQSILKYNQSMQTLRIYKLNISISFLVYILISYPSIRNLSPFSYSSAHSASW